MIIRTKTPYLGKKRIWIKFVTSAGEYEKFYDIRLSHTGKKTFSYEVDDDFPEEMIKLIFGHEILEIYR